MTHTALAQECIEETTRCLMDAKRVRKNMTGDVRMAAMLQEFDEMIDALERLSVYSVGLYLEAVGVKA
jgi:hypothetical protein